MILTLAASLSTGIATEYGLAEKRRWWFPRLCTQHRGAKAGAHRAVARDGDGDLVGLERDDRAIAADDLVVGKQAGGQDFRVG